MEKFMTWLAAITGVIVAWIESWGKARAEVVEIRTRVAVLESKVAAIETSGKL